MGLKRDGGVAFTAKNPRCKLLRLLGIKALLYIPVSITKVLKFENSVLWMHLQIIYHICVMWGKYCTTLN